MNNTQKIQKYFTENFPKKYKKHMSDFKINQFAEPDEEFLKKIKVSKEVFLSEVIDNHQKSLSPLDKKLDSDSVSKLLGILEERFKILFNFYKENDRVTKTDIRTFIVDVKTNLKRLINDLSNKTRDYSHLKQSIDAYASGIIKLFNLEYTKEDLREFVKLSAIKQDLTDFFIKLTIKQITLRMSTASTM